MNALDSCLACRSGHLVPFAKKTVGALQFEIRKCRSCGSGFAFPRPTQAEMDAYYRDRAYAHQTLAEALEIDQSYYPDSAADAVRIVGRCLDLTAGKDFADVGAGFGYFTKEAAARGYRVTAIEPNPNAASALKEYTGVEPLRTHLSEEVARSRAGAADVVLLSQVLEHLPDIDQAVGAISDLLRPGGVAAIAVPHFRSALSIVQGKHDMYLTPPEHVNYFTIRGLNRLFLRFGFIPVYLETVTKVPKERIRRAVPFHKGEDIAWRTVYRLLHAFDCVHGGMVINAYFRKQN